MSTSTLHLTPIPGGADAPAEGVPARVPPHNYEAEQALLGAILVNNRAYEKVSEYLLAEHFAHPAHASIYRACGRLLEAGHMVTPVTLKTYLERDAAVSEVGGMEYLTTLVNSVVTIINAGDYGRQIYDLYLRRQLIDLGEDLVNNAYTVDFDSSARDHIESAEQQLYDLATTGDMDQGFQQFSDALAGAIEMAQNAHRRAGTLAGVTTGLIDMDRKLGGLHPSDLLILAGRPSMGKTSLATNIAFNAAKAYKETIDDNGIRKVEEGARVAFFSLEMSAEQLASRILAEQAEISSHKLRTGDLDDADFQRMIQVSQELQNLPLYIDDTPALTVSALRTRCRRLARQNGGQGLGLIIIDYLQLLSGGGGKSSENRVQEVSAITRGLKALAKEMDVPVMALSQLSRAVEQRDDKKPQLADLRESGSIEQDADVVMFVYREEYYLARAEPGRKPEEDEARFGERYTQWQERLEKATNVGEVIIGKQRHGPIGSVRLFFDSQYTKFGNLVNADQYADDDE
ncbi:Replicative DNA helicase [Caenispirillum salinarum AK4]|uniref:Replicative DNA helicase n=1 Tax=Caenispirillum salinarum AK4 TaxID=1238182 RepID=K9HQ13_9PROT|nr:replicative DNA helicase [Caenispirillum salinarum]EKV32383.1 Replicative DNA helicase [Caenispirillum salinarum AK4]